MEKKELGKNGEDLACDYLRQKGYQIDCRNYVWGKGELDIIAMDQQQLVVVEVKTRHTDFFGSPSNSVTRNKQRQIIKITNRYVNEKELDLEVRFDVIAIVLNQYAQRIEHIENAFVPYAT